MDREVHVPFTALADRRGVLESEIAIRDGELTPKLERQWDALKGTVGEKAYRVALGICDLQADIAGIDHEIERLTERRSRKVRRAEHKKDFLKPHLERHGIRRVEGALCTVTLHANSTLSVDRATDPSDQTNLFAPQSGGASSSRATEGQAVRGSHVRVY